MTLPKTLALVLACSLGSFIAGAYAYATRSPVALSAKLSLALQLHQDLKEIFGEIHDPYSRDPKVIDRVHVVKDIDFAVYQDNGCKSVRVFDQ